MVTVLLVSLDGRITAWRCALLLLPTCQRTVFPNSNGSAIVFYLELHLKDKDLGFMAWFKVVSMSQSVSHSCARFCGTPAALGHLPGHLGNRGTGELTYPTIYHLTYSCNTIRVQHSITKTERNKMSTRAQHPAGWSTINDADFSKKPGFEEKGFFTTGPHCYCHGGRHEAGFKLTQKNASGSGCEWAYVFDGDTMLILSSYRDDGGKMIGMFGMGDDKAKWVQIAVVDLNGKEPNWEVLENTEPALN